MKVCVCSVAYPLQIKQLVGECTTVFLDKELVIDKTDSMALKYQSGHTMLEGAEPAALSNSHC